MERTYYVVDAFASQPFTGNPAAIVLDARGLDDLEMQAIAAEFNLSETTFILPPTATGLPVERNGSVDAADLSVRFRWFTPTTEVNMCGHATVGGVHALHEAGHVEIREGANIATVRIETKSGILTAFIERIPGGETGTMIWLQMIDPELSPVVLVQSELASALNLPVDAFDGSLPIAKTQDRDVIVFVRDFQALNEARPDFARLARLLESRRLRGLCVATVKTLAESINVQSRFFAPTAGVDEDPVTGSVHGPLAAYLVEHGLVEVHGGAAALRCAQAKAGGRAGLLYALVHAKDGGGYRVRIGGQAVTTMRGVLLV
jgi:PhzF family phenazine biosynthesis protein